MARYIRSPMEEFLIGLIDFRGPSNALSLVQLSAVIHQKDPIVPERARF